MFKLFKKPKPSLKVVEIKEVSLNAGKSIYTIKDQQEFFNLVDPNIIVYLTPEDLMIQELAGVILLCQFKEQSSEQPQNSENN